MHWGNGRDASGQTGYPQGSFSPNTPTPAYPTGVGQAPTPPYSPDAPAPPYRSGGQGPTPPYQPKSGAGQKRTQSPAERLADARRTPRQTANPDGTPAPLPASFGGGSRAGGGRGKVVQRFSGSGLAPKTKVQRQERRAKRATVALAAIAVVLIAASAFMLFDPNLELPSFGFALNQRIHTQNSDVPLYVDGTQPPTNTPTGGLSSPTPLGSNGGGSPTATPKPTATPRPTFTPTPIPTRIPDGASVTFTATTAQTYTSNGALTACGSGCSFATRSANRQVQGNGYTKTTVSGFHGGSWNYTFYYTVTLTETCSISPHVCVAAAWNGGNVNIYDSSANFICTAYFASGTTGTNMSYRNNTTGTFRCTLPWSTELTNTNLRWSFSGTGMGCTGCATDNEYDLDLSFSTGSGSCTSSCHYYPTNNDCVSAYNNDYSSANGKVGGDAANWANSNGFSNQVVTGQSNAGGSCSPAPGTWDQTSITGYAKVNYSVIAWSPADAQNASVQQFNSQYPLPAANYWVSGPTPCASPSYNSYGGGTYHVTCAATGTAQYDWRASSSAGTTARNNLIAALANKPYATAVSICNSTPGIVAGSCTISLSGGNVKIMPDSSKIQLFPQ